MAQAISLPSPLGRGAGGEGMSHAVLCDSVCGFGEVSRLDCGVRDVAAAASPHPCPSPERRGVRVGHSQTFWCHWWQVCDAETRVGIMACQPLEGGLAADAESSGRVGDAEAGGSDGMDQSQSQLGHGRRLPRHRPPPFGSDRTTATRHLCPRTHRHPCRCFMHNPPVAPGERLCLASFRLGGHP